MNQANNFDDFASDYKGHISDALGVLGGDVNYYVERKVQILRKLLKGQKIERILDFGCGIGQAVPFLKNYFDPATLVGSDSSSESLAIAHHQYNFLATSEPNQLEDQYFDLIFVSNVLHHIDPVKRADVMRQLCSKLRIGGKIAVFEHNPFNPITRRVVGNCVFDEGVELLSSKNVRRLLEESKLINEVICGYCMFVPEKMRRLNRLEGFLTRIPLGGQHFTLGSR